MSGGFYVGQGRHKHLHHCRKFYCMAIELWFSSSESSGGIVKTSDTAHALPQPTPEFLSQWVWERLEDFHFWWFPRWFPIVVPPGPLVWELLLCSPTTGEPGWKALCFDSELMVQKKNWWTQLPEPSFQMETGTSFLKANIGGTVGCVFEFAQETPTPTQQNIPAPP